MTTNTRRGKWMPGCLSAPPEKSSRVSCRPAVDLLSLAKQNGTAGATRGLTALLAYVEPLDPVFKRSRRELVNAGRSVTVCPIGGATRTPEQAAALLQFATDFFESGGAT